MGVLQRVYKNVIIKKTTNQYFVPASLRLKALKGVRDEDSGRYTSQGRGSSGKALRET